MMSYLFMLLSRFRLTDAQSLVFSKQRGLKRMSHAAKLSHGFTVRLPRLRLTPAILHRMLCLKLFLRSCTDPDCADRCLNKMPRQNCRGTLVLNVSSIRGFGSYRESTLNPRVAFSGDQGIPPNEAAAPPCPRLCFIRIFKGVPVIGIECFDTGTEDLVKQF